MNANCDMIASVILCSLVKNESMCVVTFFPLAGRRGAFILFIDFSLSADEG